MAENICVLFSLFVLPIKISIKCRKKVVCNIGPLSRFYDGEPVYVDRLKKSSKVGNPLIPELLPYCSEQRPFKKYQFSFT